MQQKIEEMQKEITHIQNSMWAIYKSFLTNHDKEEYNEGMLKLMKEYCDKKDEMLLSFCKYQYISWDQVIRWFAQEFRNSE